MQVRYRAAPWTLSCSLKLQEGNYARLLHIAGLRRRACPKVPDKSGSQVTKRANSGPDLLKVMLCEPHR